jgi:hypothetical protein
MLEIGLAVALVGVAAVASYMSAKKADEVARYEQKAFEWHGVAATYWTRFETLRSEARGLREANLALEQKIASFKVTPAPKPVPHPPEAIQARLDLKNNGMMHPEVLLDPDVQTVWVWSEEAKRVPLLEARAFDLEAISSQKDKLIDGLKAENAVHEKAEEDASQALKAKDQETLNLKEALSAYKKKEKASKVKTVLRDGAIVALAFVLGKSL